MAHGVTTTTATLAGMNARTTVKTRVKGVATRETTGNHGSLRFSLRGRQRAVRVRASRASVDGAGRRGDIVVVDAFRNAPEPKVEEEEGSVLDFPEEYVRAVPSRRPDIFPDLKEPKMPMPRPMPGDPEMPDEESEEKERKENPGEPGEKPEDEEEEDAEKKKKKKKKELEEEEE
ncbi:unnamed product [Ostreococcus tauri]|uniref:Unnamed product n=1 Tax=Ostreococcus tauri TaxID=70448 RepID=A0A090M3T5_OSTTA|nr:unnamed product [Ostreococcus tauri]CEF96679.1 unnamed product [Ostreococcus tauri]|eukprot:XP_022838235.1 unnamed product [Ostreococcus tauri]